MTNEEKASDIVIKIQNSSSLDYDGRRTRYMYDAALEMAEWKDEQFKESVNKAMKRLETNLQLTEAESTHIRKLFNF